MSRPKDIDRLGLIRRAELSTDIPFIGKAPNTVLPVIKIPMRMIDCYCGAQWWSHPVLDAPGNLCPTCNRGAPANRAGPVVHRSIDIPINVSGG